SVYDNGTNVGIGTKTPTANFHSKGTVRFEGLSGYKTRIVTTDSAGNLSVAQADTTIGSAIPAATILNTTCLGISSTISLSGLPSVINTSTISVKINITHPAANDLQIY